MKKFPILDKNHGLKAPCLNSFQACERAESGNLIGFENGRYFTILPANPGGIVGSFIHKFVFQGL